MVVKAVIFDCFGVLVSSARRMLMRDFPELKDQIESVSDQFDRGVTTRLQFIDSLAKVCDMTYSEMESRYLGMSVCDEDAINWARRTKSTGKYKIGMLSNVGYGFMETFFDESAQKELFDEVVLSCDVGLAKPDAAIFDLTARRLGVLPGECIMIDDTLTNIDGARKVGMQAILFESVEQAEAELSALIGG